MRLVMTSKDQVVVEGEKINPRSEGSGLTLSELQKLAQEHFPDVSPEHLVLTGMSPTFALTNASA